VRSSRVMTIILDSAISDAQWNKYVSEIEETVLQASCDYAAACEDDTYRVKISTSKFREH
jgi:hypothetical protein